jgi:hypothetical protein
MCTLVQALRLCTGRTAHTGSRGIALPFLDYGTRRGWEVSLTPRSLCTFGKDPVPIVQEAGWAPGPVWTGAENLASTGIRSPERPARSQSRYSLRYPAHETEFILPVITKFRKLRQVYTYKWLCCYLSHTQAGSQNCAECKCLLYVHSSVRPYVTTRLPLERYTLNLISEYFTKICWENSSFLNIRQE